jgi:imidazolonepropionase-like amidohydrolase
MRSIYMRLSIFRFLMLFALALSIASPQDISKPLNVQDRPIAICNVRVFDGSQVLPKTTVLVSGGTVIDMDPSLKVPEGAEIIIGDGLTLLPGLIDSHVHAESIEDLERSLVFGVTTVLDMGTRLEFSAQMRREEQEGLAKDRADLFFAGNKVTARGGHGTEYGYKVPTIESPQEADAFVRARIAEGSDYIKIIYDDGKSYGSKFNRIDPQTMKAVIDAAHRNGKLVVVHALTLKEAQEAVDAGANGLAHAFADQSPDSRFISSLKAKNVFMIGTLTAIESLTGVPSGESLTRDSRLEPFLSDAEIRNLRRCFPFADNSKLKFPVALDVVRKCRESGIQILAGTDAASEGTSHGVSLHRELELLVAAGLSPQEALESATSIPASVFGLQGRGRIAPGLRANLLLVKGNPLIDIQATRDIVGVWKEGTRISRNHADRSLIPSISPFKAESGRVSDFDAGKNETFFGLGWRVTTDRRLGGASTAELSVVEGGAEGSQGALKISGNIDPGDAYPWAGAAFMPGSKPMEPVDLSRYTKIVFWAKGEGKNYRLLLTADRFGFIPVAKEFKAGLQWKRYEFPFAAFSGFDGKGLMLLVFSGGTERGPFTLLIDNIEFR